MKKKVLFVESRYITNLYEEVSKTLEDNGCEIYWLIVNHRFVPKSGKAFVIDYPNGKTYPKERKEYLDIIIDTDRQLRFFGKKSTDHFYYYDNEINNIFDELSPDIVFGEPTTFHHLIAIEASKKRNILYLHPGTCRYPINRFAFYKYDTLETYGGSNELLPKEAALELIDCISARKVIPNYMVPPNIPLKAKLQDKIKILGGYFEGEKYNTPSPYYKYTKELKNRQLLKKWNTIGSDTIDSSRFVVLFPLHMQPESSIDVWGRKFSDQAETIKEIATQLGPDDLLYIKPNPKSAFEINEKIIHIVENTDNILALRNDTKMDDIFNKIDLFINIVGTISIECILSDKPVISLISTYFNNVTSSYNIDSFEEIKDAISEIKNGVYKPLDEDEKISYINLLNSISYNGLISDPHRNKMSVGPNNIKNLSTGFLDVILQK